MGGQKVTGRQRARRNELLRVCMTAEELEGLDALAMRAGRTRSDVLRTIVGLAVATGPGIQLLPVQSWPAERTRDAA